MRGHILNYLYLYREINFSAKEFSQELGLKEHLKAYIDFLIEEKILHGKYTGNKFIVTNIYKYPIIKENSLNKEQIILFGLLIPTKEATISDLLNVTKWKKEELLKYLFSLNFFGMIHAQVTSKTIISEWLWVPSKPLELSNKDHFLIGAFMMLRTASLSEVSKLTKIPEKEMLLQLSTIILYRKVEVSLSLSSKFFGNSEVYVNIRRYLISPDIRELNTLAIEEKLIVGYVILKKEISLIELSAFLGKEIKEILEILAIFTAKGTFQTVFTENKLIVPLKIPKFSPTRTIEEVAALSFINYETILGLLSTRSEIKISELSKIVNREQEAVLEAIINLMLEGFISGTLHKKTLILEQVKSFSRTQEGALEQWEKIVLGMVISKNEVSVKDVSLALGIDKSIAKEKLYAFLGKGLIQGRIVSGKLYPEVVPIFPPLSQLDSFPPHYIEIYGYITSNVTPNVKEIEKYWEKSPVASLNIIYELAGSGLLTFDQKGKLIKVMNFQEFLPTKELADLDKSFLNLVNEIERTNSKNIRLENLTKRLNIRPTDIFKKICMLLAMGYYKGKISPNRFVISKRLTLPAKKLNCLSCGFTIQSTSDPCPNCRKMHSFCTVCNGFIKVRDEVLICPSCDNMAHKEHLLQWLKIKEECPICKSSINERTLTTKIL